MEKTSKITYYLILVGIIIFSFFNFSERFYPLLNSDYAINVLMTYKLNLPQDLYFWGQDRGGSLLPMLANLVYKVTSLSPIVSVSIIHYLILTLGYFALSTFFKNKSSKILLALVWFFPTWYYSAGFLLNFYGIQFSLMTIALFFLKRMMDSDNKFYKGINLVRTLIFLIISVWVSDLAIVSVFLLICFAVVLFVKNNKRPIKEVLKPFNLISIGLIIAFGIVGLLFIIYAKEHATTVENYKQLFSNTKEIGITLKVIMKTLGKVFMFKSESLLVSVYTYLIVIGIPLSIILSKASDNIDKSKNTTFYFFLIFALLNFIVLIISHWVFANACGRRYLTITYMSFAIAILLYFDITTSKFKSLRMTILFVVVICGSLSSVIYFYYPKRIPPAYNAIKQFETLGQAGIIAEYWNSYANACGSPELIIATPHDKSDVRNPLLVDEVFNQPKLYVLKVYWMDDYPDTLLQFNRTLIKKGHEFPIAGMDVCEYEVVE